MPLGAAVEQLVALHAADARDARDRAHAKLCAEAARACTAVNRSVRAVATRLRALHGRSVLEATLLYALLVARGALPPEAALAALGEAARLLGFGPAELRALAARFEAAGESALDPDVAASLDRLGVSSDVTEEALRAAYRAAVRAHHPDRVTRRGGEALEAARVATVEINVAHDRVRAWIEAGRPVRKVRARASAPPPAPPDVPVTSRPFQLRGRHVLVLAVLVLAGGVLVGRRAPRDGAFPTRTPGNFEVRFRAGGAEALEVRCGHQEARGAQVTLHLPAPLTCSVRAGEGVSERRAELKATSAARWLCFAPEERACRREEPDDASASATP
jgi:DnaJ-domain-containing protein 1